MRIRMRNLSVSLALNSLPDLVFLELFVSVGIWRGNEILALRYLLSEADSFALLELDFRALTQSQIVTLVKIRIVSWTWLVSLFDFPFFVRRLLVLKGDNRDTFLERFHLSYSWITIFHGWRWIMSSKMHSITQEIYSLGTRLCSSKFSWLD